MQLAIANFSFEIVELEPTLMISRALGFDAVDIGAFHDRGHCSFEPEALLADPQGNADQLNRLLDRYELRVTDVFPQWGAAPSLHSFNDPDPAVRAHSLELVRGAARFTKLVGSPGMTVLPGVDHTSRPLAENLEISGAALKRAVEIAGEEGIELRFEPHMSSVSDTPELALQLVEMAPGLKVTLDYTHFVLQYISLERIHALIPYTGHVHVRQAGWGQLQSSFHMGVIDYADVVARLESVGYTGALTSEYVCSDWYDINQNDVVFESVAVRDALRPLLH
jgi:sugar phosphate isomerase/epimerase